MPSTTSVSLPGIHPDKIPKDEALIAGLRNDDMERFAAVPKTVMINQWNDTLEWLIIDHNYPRQIARRLGLLVTRKSMVIDRLPGNEVAAAEKELLGAVVDYLLQTYPQYFARQGNLVLSPLTGLAVDVGDNGADPLTAIALLASEDMLILLPESQSTADRNAHYVLKSGALLFPNDWSLRSHFQQTEPDASENKEAWKAWQTAKLKSEKAARLGKSPAAIHEGHVAHYMQHFAARVDMFFTRMEPGMRTWRRNWGPRMTSELFLHSDALPAELPAYTAENWAHFGHLRSEHEVFTKLPQSGAVVFSIKTFVWKLSELVKSSQALQALLNASDNLAPTMFDYRADSLPTFGEFLEQHRKEKGS